MFFSILLAFLMTIVCQGDPSIVSGSLSVASTKAPIAAKPVLDEAMWDAVYEAALVLFVFCVGTLLIHGYGLVKSDSSPRARRPSPVQDTKHTQSEVSEKGQRPASFVLEAANQDSQKVPHRSRSWSTTSSIATECAETQTGATLDALSQAVRSGRAAQLPWYLDRLHAQCKASSSAESQDISTHHLLAALRACASARCFREGLLAYQHVASRIDTGQGALWSLLLYCAVETGSCELGADFFEKICDHSRPSNHDFVNMVRCHVHQHDFQGLQGMLAELRTKGCSVDSFATNKALAACAWAPLEFAEAVAHDVRLDAIGYNTLMKLHAKAGCLKRIIELRAEMVDNGIAASEVTFGVLLDASVGAGEYDLAKSIFVELRNSGVRPNVVHCTTFIKGLVAAGRLDQADEVLAEMLRMPGTRPDLITYSTLVKAHAHKGNLAGARGVLEKMVQQGVKPDDIILNSVLSSCCGGAAEPAVTLRTFEALISNGLKPSTMTLSILLKALLFNGAWEFALNTLKKSVQRFEIDAQARLYAQIVQACLKAHEHVVALQAYEAMLDAVVLHSQNFDSTMCSRLVRQCTLNGDHETSSKMLHAARRAGIIIDSQNASAANGSSRGGKPWC